MLKKKQITGIENILDECINCLQRGEPLESCLQAYPDYAQELEPLLLIAQKLDISAAKQQNQNDLENALSGMRVAFTQDPAGKTDPGLFSRLVYSSFFMGLTAACMLVITGLTAGYMTSKALPGETLYPAKLFFEKMDMEYLTAKNERAEKNIELADRRLGEVRKVAGTKHIIDKDALHSMHRHTEIALSQADEYPAEEMHHIISRIQELHRKQIGQLASAQSEYNADNSFNASIQLCNDRMNWVSEMQDTLESK
ncbi:MAG: hypothetical protein A2252_08640 [Elusimicrobia bacterium RIFOXYA2_FULL_39_19]|nr:MAG: hypothetical protein A2252_08640 [Elusimicrobia bacterium RIFOXYA2_FULL_39_19]